MKNMLRKYWLWIAITALFAIFITFITPNSLIGARRLKREIRSLEESRLEAREEARRDSAFLENLKDDEFLEKFARENFNMKREGEEIYIIE